MTKLHQDAFDAAGRMSRAVEALTAAWRQPVGVRRFGVDFLSVGTALADLFTAKASYDRAIEAIATARKEKKR